ncbi:RNA polymerase sigma-70 factor, ECF subfamily [Steroidobacter denitrificans]|uniref:RNA polymerase sigma-70 factor, ECF subfamily n=1 Tax=Steroidobacter denitrificans TaxID=465721 RepID=A0A127F9K7_STEDE|nr:RNA polymerase sigma factor [Steroidobacter denitrificans]AMN46285.1 RNA polymerase sigma-70 factor, ECF subfamily [Steroidobacter denitrificans]
MARSAIRSRTIRDGRLASWFVEWRVPIRKWLSSRSSVPAADLDDVAQEVFLRLLRYSDDIVIDNPQGYLFRVAANVASEWRERARLRCPHDQNWLHDLSIEPANEPENAVARAVLGQHVRAAIDRLPPRQRTALLLHVNDGLTYMQIAERLGLSYRAVMRDLTRAYSRLRLQLNAEDPGGPNRC